MPVSNKDFSDVLYDHLPELYHTEDAKVQPMSHPLKRFMQVASTGFKEIESEIDGLQLLFNADFMPEKYLDPVSRMLGFDFPVGTTVTEKRRIIQNLPTLYKLKGNEQVFEMLARLIFHKDAKTSTKWVRTENTTNVQVNLEVGDNLSSEIDAKMERFQELVQFFRPVNVGNTWNMVVFYDYLVSLMNKDDYEFTVINMDDNLNPVRKDVALINSNRLISNNFDIYGGNKIPEAFSFKGSTDDSLDVLKYAVMSYEVPIQTDELDHLDTLSFAIENENFEIYPLDMGGEDVIVDYRRMLNYGLLGSTIILNDLPKVTRL